MISSLKHTIEKTICNLKLSSPEKGIPIKNKKNEKPMSRKKEAFQLFKEDKFKEAAELFRTEWSNNRDTFSHFDKKTFARVLYKTKEYKESYNIYTILEQENYHFNNWEKMFFAQTCRKFNIYEKGLELCKGVMTKNPRFNQILSTYYWIKYDSIIKGEPYNEIDEEKGKLAQEIKNKFQASPKFSPFYHLCIYFSDIYIENNEFEEAKKWLKYIRHYNDLNKTFKIGEDIYYVPHKAKYFINYCKVCEENEIKKAIKICMKGLSIYPNLSFLKTSLVNLVSRQFNLEGKELFFRLLSKAYFSNDKIRNSYLNKLIDEEVLLSWEWTNKIGQKVYELNFDFDTKNKKNWTIYPSLFKSISSSNISDYVFCPVSYSINKSINIEQDEHINIVSNYSSKISISKIYGNRKKFDNINEALKMLPNTLDFLLEIKNTSNYRCLGIPEDFSEIFNLRLLENNVRSKNRNIHESLNKKFKASPDYVMINEETGKKIIIEEKYRYSESSNIESPFQSNYFEIANTIFNIEEFRDYEVYIVYWFWKFIPNDNTEFERFFAVTDWKIFKVDFENYSKLELDGYVKNIEALLDNKTLSFKSESINSLKCVNCSVRHYCYHKTGRINEISLPYKKYDLEIISE